MSCTGKPVEIASLAHSSYSALHDTMSSPSMPIFTEISPDTVSSLQVTITVTNFLCSVARSMFRSILTPRVVVWRKISSKRRPGDLASDLQRQLSDWATRPFFIIIGCVQTSKAPFSRRTSVACDKCSGVISSILAMTCVTKSVFHKAEDSDVEEAGGAIGFGIVAALIISLLLAPFAIPPVSFGAAFREDERLDGAWECETGSFVLLI
mmetsp:Transcript_5164/g.14625  ORF Transcript_5164/g.14625 Transcript_5164/m.14625 type:complete len:209 (-) Transcript_5164:387-1013(-)